ncbi:MAG: 50S ribosomal protein L24 [Bacteroidota bacterium]|nr:50S ribosomal protein L24 [Bacteroidota bacterium]
MKIKKGDNVQVISGANKGKKGVVTYVIPATYRAVVEGVNIVKKHTKPANNNPGGIVDTPAPLHMSNLSLLDPKSGAPTRVGYKEVDGKKVRYSKKSGETIK